MEEDYLLPVSDVAKRLGTNKNFVYELINKRLLKALKLGSIKVRNSEINRFLKDSEGKDFTDLNNVTDLN